MPIAEVFQFDPNDEGIELIKAISHLNGFALYTQIYNDQPPLSTIFLSGWLQVFGKSILAARLLTLSFSTLLVWAFCQTLRLYLGSLPALIGTGFLIISCNFLRLSVSVMFGLPALALAMLAIYTFALYKQDSHKSDKQPDKQQRHTLSITLLLSGACLALSLQIKLFTALIIPLIMFDFIQAKSTQWQQKKFRRALVFDLATWLAALIGVFVLVGIEYHALSYEQLIRSHFDQTVKIAFDPASSYELVEAFLFQDFDYLLLAIPATIVLWKTKRWQQLLPLIWLILALIVLIQHRPVWYHHYLLVSLPLAWLATDGVVLSFAVFRQWNWRSPWRSGRGTSIYAQFAAGCVILSLLLIPVKLAVTQLENHRALTENPEHIQLIKALQIRQKSTHWIFTDCPLYAFDTGLNVPPEIAVLSFIRIESNTITKAQLLDVFEKYHPEQTLLCKSSTLQNKVHDYMNQHYLKSYENEDGIAYQLK